MRRGRAGIQTGMMKKLPFKAGEGTTVRTEKLYVKQIKEFQHLRLGDVPAVFIDVADNAGYQLFYRSVHALGRQGLKPLNTILPQWP